MSFILGLAQCTHPADGNVVGMARFWFEAAAASKVDLLVFPEAFMGPYDEERGCYRADPEPLDGPFAHAIDALAAEFGIWIVYTLNELNPSGGRPFNTAVVTDSAGAQRGAYRKVHLFDAQGYRESDRLSAGSELFAPIETPFGKLGLAICYDLRFPEVARAAALAGCQVMLYPAAWVSGPKKALQWETLLEARAIENSMFVAGVTRTDRGYIGNSCIFGPDGALLADGEPAFGSELPKSMQPDEFDERNAATEMLVMAQIDLTRIDEVRTATPSLAHRRPDVY